MRKIIFLLIFLAIINVSYAITDAELYNYSVLIWAGENNMTDSSPKGIDLASGTGAPTYKADCHVGGCYEFDGNDALNAGTARIYPDDNYMFCHWANVSTAIEDYGSFIGQNKGDSSDYTTWWASVSTYSGHEVASWEIPSGTVVRAAGNEIRGKGWMHFCVAYNSTDLVVYENGTRINSSSGTDTTNTNEAVFAIGGYYEGSYYWFFKGRMDEMYWFNDSFNNPSYTYNGKKGTDAAVDYLYHLDHTLTNESGDTIPPTLFNYNLTSEGGCTVWNTDQSSPCSTEETTPAVTVNTTETAFCRIGITDANWTGMGAGTECAGENSTSHTCTLTTALSSGEQNIYIGCKDLTGNENQTTSTSGALRIKIFSSETGGNQQ